MQTQTPSLDDLGVIEHAAVNDPLAFWRAEFYTGKAEPVEMLFAEEPEHRAIEELMARTDATSVSIFPPTAEEPRNAEEAAERLLAIARGMKTHSDPESVAALVAAAAAYQSLYRTAARHPPRTGTQP